MKVERMTKRTFDPGFRIVLEQTGLGPARDGGLSLARDRLGLVHALDRPGHEIGGQGR